jgi:hypothetical protein
MNRHPVPQPGTVIVDEGMSKRELALLATASSTLVISVAISIAVWRISTGLMWALIIMSIGSAGQMLLVGAGIYQKHRLSGQALVIEAEGRAKASTIQAQAQLTAARRDR